MRHLVFLFVLVALACAKTETVASHPQQFAGVGVELRERQGTMLVERTLPGGPADEAGVQPGDRVISVDGAEIDGMSLGDVVMRIRGRPDAPLQLTLDRSGQRIILVVRRRGMARQGDEDYRTVVQ